MDKKHFILTSLLAHFMFYHQIIGQTKKLQTKVAKYELTPALGRPFGTIINLQVQIIDGDSLKLKETQSHFYVKIKKIENKVFSDSLVLSFDDRTGSLPEDLENLYWHVYDHRPKYGVTSDTASSLRRNYVGKVYNIAAYESGFFWGMPDNYTNYADIRQEPSFQFRSILIIVSDVYKPKHDN